MAEKEQPHNSAKTEFARIEIEDNLVLKETYDSDSETSATVLRLPVESGPPNVESAAKNSLHESSSLGKSVPGSTKTDAGASLSDLDLLAIAMNPHAPESEWVTACSMLNQRESAKRFLGSSRRGEREKLRWRLATISVAVALMATFGYVALSQHFWGSSEPSQKLTYTQLHAQYKNNELVERQAVRVATELHKRAWSAEKAADFFGLPAPQVKDLIEARKKHHLTLDQLNQMLFAMGHQAMLPAKMTEQEKLDAVAHYSCCIAQDPNNQHALWRLGTAYEKLGRYDLAVKAYTRSLELRPNRDWLIEHRAKAYLELKQYDKALADANTLVSRFASSEGQELRGTIYQELQQYKEALQDHSESIAKMQEPDPDAYTNRAAVYEKLGKYKEAIYDWEKAQQIDPNNSDVDENIARLRTLLNS